MRPTKEGTTAPPDRGSPLLPDDHHLQELLAGVAAAESGDITFFIFEDNEQLKDKVGSDAFRRFTSDTERKIPAPPDYCSTSSCGRMTVQALNLGGNLALAFLVVRVMTNYSDQALGIIIDPDSDYFNATDRTLDILGGTTMVIFAGSSAANFTLSFIEALSAPRTISKTKVLIGGAMTYAVFQASLGTAYMAEHVSTQADGILALTNSAFANQRFVKNVVLDPLDDWIKRTCLRKPTRVVLQRILEEYRNPKNHSKRFIDATSPQERDLYMAALFNRHRQLLEANSHASKKTKLAQQLYVLINHWEEYVNKTKDTTAAVKHSSRQPYIKAAAFLIATAVSLPNYNAGAGAEDFCREVFWSFLCPSKYMTGALSFAVSLVQRSLVLHTILSYLFDPFYNEEKPPYHCSTNFAFIFIIPFIFISSGQAYAFSPWKDSEGKVAQSIINALFNALPIGFFVAMTMVNRLINFFAYNKSVHTLTHLTEELLDSMSAENKSRFMSQKDGPLTFEAFLCLSDDQRIKISKEIHHRQAEHASELIEYLKGLPDTTVDELFEAATPEELEALRLAEAGLRPRLSIGSRDDDELVNPSDMPRTPDEVKSQTGAGRDRSASLRVSPLRRAPLHEGSRTPGSGRRRGRARTVTFALELSPSPRTLPQGVVAAARHSPAAARLSPAAEGLDSELTEVEDSKQDGTTGPDISQPPTIRRIQSTHSIPGRRTPTSPWPTGGSVYEERASARKLLEAEQRKRSHSSGYSCSLSGLFSRCCRRRRRTSSSDPKAAPLVSPVTS